MLIETIAQWVAPMLVELAIREVAVPAAKKLVAQRSIRVAGAGPADAPTTGLLLSPVQAVQVVSAIAGRVRVQVAGLSGQATLARRLEREIGALAGVLEATANARTGRMLVQFDPAVVRVETLVGAIDRTRAASLPSTPSQTRRLAAVV